ncbi:unnamed protein product [Prunus armeniaca]
MLNQKLHISRHVIHDESLFPFKVLKSPPISTTVASSNPRPVNISVTLPHTSSQQSTSSAQSSMEPHSELPMSNNTESLEFSSGSILPVTSTNQLEVVLPISPNSNIHESSDAYIMPHSTNCHPMQTRLKSGVVQKRQFPEFSCFATMLTSVIEPEAPTYFKAAAAQLEWQQAMAEEIQALQLQGTWNLVPPPPDKNIVGCRWIYKIKRNSYGTISRYKARLVAQGFSQEHGLDYDETFSPVVRHTTVRLVLSLVTMFKWDLRQLDVKNAFLHGELQEEAPRAWNAKFKGYLPSLGSQSSHSDPSLFVRQNSTFVVILLLYVDDIIITGSDTQVVQSVIDSLGEVFDMKDTGRLTYFLGLEVHYQDNGDIFVNQAKYARDLFKKAGMDTCKPCLTPIKPHQSVLKDEGTIQYGITFSPGSMLLSGYCDSDWAGDPNTRRSTTGYVVFLDDNPISWLLKKQAAVSRSSTEAEYHALANCAADIAWIRQIMCDLHMTLPEAPIIHSDNMSALALSVNPVFHSRIKHLEIDYHFVRERVQCRDLVVQYIPTDGQVADILSKGLHSLVFIRHRSNLRLGNNPAEIEGEC